MKHTRYFLIAGVTLVWGLIIYRIVSGMGGDDYKMPFAQKQETFQYAVQTDSFALIADYPDPFIPDDSEPALVQVQTDEKVVPGGGTAPSFDKTMIQYHGMIANPDTKLKLATITIKGKDHLVREKEKVDEITIRKIERERLVLIYRGKTITVDRN